MTDSKPVAIDDRWFILMFRLWLAAIVGGLLFAGLRIGGHI